MADLVTMTDNQRPSLLRSLGILLFALVVLFPACTDTPTAITSVGGSLIEDNFFVRDTTLQVDTAASFRQTVPMDSSLTLFAYPDNVVELVGKAGKYTAYTALQFPPSVVPNRDTINVLSATLTLRMVSWYGDSSGTCAFTIHKITQGWTQQRLTWDSVQTGFYESGIVRGSYSGPVDADTQVIAVELDTSMVREWIQNATYTSYGILLVPTASATVVRGINSFENDSTSFWPSLRVVAQNVAGTTLDTTDYQYGIDTFVGDVENLTTDPALLYIQAGIVYRSRLTFDVSSIPRGSLISSAELTLVRDPSTSRPSKFSAAPLVFAHVLNSETDYLSFESQSSSAQQVETTDTFRVDLRHAVQAWIKQNNFGILLRANTANEFNGFDLITFFNQIAANDAVRPKLRVKYIIQTM
jgi:hypothetical protein